MGGRGNPGDFWGMTLFSGGTDGGTSRAQQSIKGD